MCKYDECSIILESRDGQRFCLDLDFAHCKVLITIRITRIKMYDNFIEMLYFLLGVFFI